MKVALTGPVQLELIASYFAKAGYGVAAPGEIPDLTYDVTSREETLAREVPGFYDPRLQQLAGCPYSLAGIEAIVEEFQWWCLRGPRKVLAVDADNTLWHGILSEDGPAALVPCVEFQQGLKQLADEGVVLVVLSKNDPDSLEKLANHNSSLFILNSSLSASRVNWGPKPGNLIEACRELKLGLDAVVFVDDNPKEREMMKAHLPEVTVAPWTGWTDGETWRERQLIRRLREYCFFDAGKTAEDRMRSDSYANLKRAEETLAKFATHEDYLRSLGLWVEARPAEARDLDRLAQMAGKTNQFNCTTLRRSRPELEALLASTFVFRAGDKFGEQGIVCYVVVDAAKRRITDFVMSCRAMGRTLECFAYEWLSRRLGYRPSIDFTPTAKNAPAREFVERVAADKSLPTYFTEVCHV